MTTTSQHFVTPMKHSAICVLVQGPGSVRFWLTDRRSASVFGSPGNAAIRRISSPASR
jgi:hypothetical protein